jgi:hypothetical protein
VFIRPTATVHFLSQLSHCNIGKAFLVLSIFVNFYCIFKKTRTSGNSCYYALENFLYSRLLSNKIWNVYSLEYTEIPKVFFAPRHGRWRQQVASLITTAQRNCGLLSLLLERNTKDSSGIQGQCCDNMVRSQCCDPTVTSVIIVTVCPNNDLGLYYYVTMRSDSFFCFYCCNSVLRQ